MDNTVSRNARPNEAFRLSKDGLSSMQIGEALGVSTTRALQLIRQGQRNEAFRLSDFSHGGLTRNTVTYLVSYSDNSEFDFRETINLKSPNSIAEFGAEKLLSIPGLGRTTIKNIRLWLDSMGLDLKP